MNPYSITFIGIFELMCNDHKTIFDVLEQCQYNYFLTNSKSFCNLCYN